MTLESVEARDAADAWEIQRIRTSGQPKEITTHLLVPMLRYADPLAPTRVESIMIPAFRAAFPQLAADFDSYQEKPTGCSCANKLISKLSNETWDTQAVLDRVFGEGLYKHVEVVQQPQPAGYGRQLAGHAVEIEATALAWKLMFAELTISHGRGSSSLLQQQYKGTHVTDVPGEAKWLVLFY